jgi:putative NADH-flavin reductase
MPAKRILLLGSTGGTGRELLAQALEKGLEVTALVRDPTKLPAVSGSVTVITGDILQDPSMLEEATRGQDAVVSALGVGQSFKPGGLITQAAPAVVSAMRHNGVRRLVFTSAFGVGPTWSDTPVLPRLVIRTLLRQIYADKAAGEAEILASPLDWTIVYPASLTHGPRTDRVRVGEHLPLRGFPRVSRADVAAVVLRLLDDPSAIHKSLLVAN